MSAFTRGNTILVADLVAAVRNGADTLESLADRFSVDLRSPEEEARFGGVECSNPDLCRALGAALDNGYIAAGDGGRLSFVRESR